MTYDDLIACARSKKLSLGKKIKVVMRDGRNFVGYFDDFGDDDEEIEQRAYIGIAEDRIGPMMFELANVNCIEILND